MKRLLLGISATLILCAGVYGGLSWLVVEQSLVAKPKEITGVPSILGMEFEEVSFSPHDEPHIQLSGWWIPNPNSSRTIVYVHGLDGAKDERLGFLQALHSNGYSIFAFDLRGHGESDKVQMGAGQHEQRDLLGAIHYAAEKQPGNSIALYGISFGGAIVLLTGSQSSSIQAIISDSSFASIPELIAEEVSTRTSMPTWGAAVLKPGIIWAAKWFKGVDILSVNPAEKVNELPFPVALIHCKDSERVPFSHAERIIANAPAKTSTLWIDGCDHAGGWDYAPQDYLTFILEYLDSRMPR